MKLNICIWLINITLKIFFLKYNIKFKCDTDFSYVPDTKTVYWSLFVVSKYDELFRKVLTEELGLNYNADIFLLSLFHEIGHHMTWNNISEEDLDYCDKIKKRIENKKKQTKKDYDIYFHLEDEWQASKWAVDYINNNPKKVKRLWKCIQKEIAFLYKLNNVEE